MEHPIKPTVAVIGAVNMDIGGSPAGTLIPRDSNPGFVTLRPGGVGRNIAHNLCLLGAEVSLLTAVGGDVYGAAILESCRALGMDMSMAAVLSQRRSSTYLYVNDEKGDMQVAVSDMDICTCIDPPLVKRHLERLNAADAVVLDANLSPETLAFAAAHCRPLLCADPVSTVKAMRLLPVLAKIHTLKPNLLEAQCLTGEEDPERAARALLGRGVKRVFISLGADGILAADGQELLRLPALPVSVVNTTGAGDAAGAALVWAGSMGRSLRESAELALRAGALTTQCTEANHPDLASILSCGAFHDEESKR